MEKKKIPVLSAIFLILGVGLMLFGIIYPNAAFGDNNTYTYEKMYDTKHVKYQFTLNTEEQLETDEVYMYLGDEKIRLSLTSSHKEGSSNYTFQKTLYGWDYVVSGDNVRVVAENTKGERIEFDEAGLYEGLKLVTTVVPIVVGVFFLIVALISALVSRKSAAIGKTVSNTIKDVGSAAATFAGEVTNKFKETVNKNKYKVCEYCGCEASLEQTRCKDCGAPLKNKH